MSNEWEFFQIPHVGVDSTTYGNPVQTRDLDMKMSNFGALWIGGRMGHVTVSGSYPTVANDYTRVTYGFAAKGAMEGAAQFGLHDVVQDAEKNENPLVAGSTVKYTRDDQMFRMTMATDDTSPKKATYVVSLPKFDVMDTNLVISGMTASKNWPSEGWRSFGGKDDFPVPTTVSGSYNRGYWR